MEQITFINTELPDIYIDKEVRTKYKDAIELTEFNVNKWREAIEKEGLSFDKELITKFRSNGRAIYDMMEKAYKDYSKTLKFVPKVELERIRQTYIDIANSLESVDTSIYAILQPYSFDFDVKNEIFSFNAKQVKDHIETIGIREFSELEKEYVRLLNIATKAILECANFEIKHNIEVYSLSTAITAPTANKGEFISLPRGFANDANIGVVNVEQIIKGVRRMEA